MDIKRMNKSKVLAALYNASNAYGAGFFQFDPNPMSEKEAEELLKTRSSFDYIKGRTLLVDLSGDSVDTRSYNKDNGPLAAEYAIRGCDCWTWFYT